MTKHLRLISVTAGLLLAGLLSAQSVNIPYMMSFEVADSLEWQNWHINEGVNAPSCPDQWMIGTDQKSDGNRSLYISNNNNTASFGAARNIQFAYRDFVLPQGNYIVAFDWKCMGAPNATLYVGCGPVSAALNCEAVVSGAPLSTDYTRWCQTATSNLKGQRYWQNGRLTGINSNGTRTMRLFFAWVSTNTDTTLYNPLSACIDNVQICKANSAPPSNITAETGCDSTIIRWTGTSDNYQLGYRRIGDDNWHNRLGLSAVAGQGEVVIEGLEEGMYDFRIRGILGNDTSVYTYLSSVVLFCPEAHCINYVNLHDTTGTVLCRTGKVGSQGVVNPTATRVGVVDYGPDDVASRHTVNWDIHAYDIRTRNRLPLIPNGELASVRLGNWNTGAEWESITYDYYVDSVYSILLLKYAVVLEDPGHGKSEQPRFTLSVKDQNGQEVDANCGSADFYAGRSSGNKGDGWHYESNLSWKEWTTYGIDLTRFVGQTLKITVTTYDCSQHGHYGYGYFCLGCAKAKIEGISCGDDAKMTAQAPDGFAYEWTSIHDPYTVVSTDRTLEVDAADTTTYRCRLTYLDQADCYFDLYSSIMPRFPYASLNYKYEPSNCQNRVVFTNTSHIVVKYEGDPAGTHHYDEPCEEYEWVINGEHLSDKNPIYFFPQEGGQFPVTLYASIADGKCTDDTTFTVDIPAIGDVLLNWSDSICYGSRYILGDQTLTASGVYTYTTKSHAGCDSICTLNLTVLPQALTTLPDTSICAETVYVMDGAIYPYTTSRKWIRHLQTRFGCDSTVVQSVILLDTIKPVVDVKEIIEDTDLGAFYFSGTGYSYYTINGVRHTEDSIVDLAPDTYLIVFYNDHGCEKAFTYDLAPGCVGGIVYQRWNDVLSVKAPEFAGGRSFVKYQWMKNGVDVPGATKSYYAAAQYPETEPSGHLDFSAVYEVALAVDSLATTDWQLSCPYRPIDVFSAIDYTDESVLLEPTFLHPGEDMMLLTTNKARVVCHSPAGMLIFSKDVSAGRTTLEAPVAPGMYVVTVFTGSNKKSYKICVTD